MSDQPVVRVGVYRQRHEEYSAGAPAPFDYGASITIPSGEGWVVAAWARTAAGDKVVAAIAERDPSGADERHRWLDRLAYSFVNVEHPAPDGREVEKVLADENGLAEYDARLEMIEQRRHLYEKLIDAAMQLPS